MKIETEEQLIHLLFGLAVTAADVKGDMDVPSIFKVSKSMAEEWAEEMDKDV